MTKSQKILLFNALVLTLVTDFSLPLQAMHVMEGYLPLPHCLVWGALCLPFLLAGYMRIKKTTSENRQVLLILAMVGAFAFVLSALKIPSVTGSSSHPTGTGLGAILFGPSIMSILGLIVLLFQAILLAHGGLTTLGANTFSMAVVGPFIAYGIYKLSLNLKLNHKTAIFLAAALGNLSTYCVTSFQLALAHNGGQFTEAFIQFASIFALTQIPLAVVEGLLTVVVMIGLENYAMPELALLKHSA